MKRMILLGMAAMAMNVFAAQQTLNTQDATKTGLGSLITKVNANFDEVYAGTAFDDVTINNATIRTNATVGGALSVTGDATVSGGDITGAATNSIDIGEIADGQFTLKRSNTGTVTLSSLDNDANAALTIEAGGNGALKLGATDSTTEISSSDWTIGTDGTIAGCSMDAAQLAGNIAAARVTNLLAGSSYSISAARLVAATIASAIDISAATNLPTSGIVLNANTKSLLDCADYSAMRTALALRPGTEVQAYDADLDKLALNDGGSLTNIGSAGINAGAITASKIDPTVVTNVLASGMVLPAVDYSAATNGAAGNIASGTLANARLDADLQALAVNNGSALTNMAVTGFAGVVAGWSGVITNSSTLGTNTIYVYNGIITNSVRTP